MTCYVCGPGGCHHSAPFARPRHAPPRRMTDAEAGEVVIRNWYTAPPMASSLRFVRRKLRQGRSAW